MKSPPRPLHTHPLTEGTGRVVQQLSLSLQRGARRQAEHLSCLQLFLISEEPSSTEAAPEKEPCS